MQARSALLGLGLVFVLAATPVFAADHAVILQYHHVSDDTPASTTTTPALFAEHLAYLADHGFRVAPLGPVLEALTGGGSLPDSTVCLTFDDGWRDVGEQAWPLVKAQGWSLTLFVATGETDAGGPGVLTWDEMRVLAAEGMTFAPHSIHHDHQGRLEPAESSADRKARLARDIETCRERLLAELGEEAVLPVYAYPFGEYDPVLQDVVSEAGLAGLGQHSGAAWSGHDPTALPRFPMGGPYGRMSDFGLKAASLPLPVTSAVPASMLSAGADPRPVLRLAIAEGGFHRDRVGAFVDGTPVTPVWEDDDRTVLVVETPADLPRGRSRTNVTAPATRGGRWYWYSHPWLRLP